MADIQPFNGVLYDTDKVRAADVLTQPYDKITPAMREGYLASSPYNLVQIELGKEQAGDTDASNKYTRARDLYRQWRQEGVLRKSGSPALYYLEQTFPSPNGSGQPLTRRGLIARVRLSRWDEGNVLPHEHTLSKPKADRMSLLQACGSQQGQIFMLYPRPAQDVSQLMKAAARAPAITVTDDYGVTNVLSEVTDATTIRAVQETLAPLPFYIADGHHRYETALAFRDQCRAENPTAGADAPAEFVMATLVDMSDPGLVVLPTHRVVSHLTAFEPAQLRKQLQTAFTIEPQPSLETVLSALKTRDHCIGLYDATGFAVLAPRDIETLRPWFKDKPPLWDKLDVAILQVAILERFLGIDDQRLRDESNVTYYREAEKAQAEVDTGRAALAFFLAATPVQDVKSIADARSRMPQKSTDFFPKLLSGMVIYEVK